MAKGNSYREDSGTTLDEEVTALNDLNTAVSMGEI